MTEAQPAWTRAHIGVGSNLGPRLLLCTAALTALEKSPRVVLAARSAWYETDPCGGPAGQRAYLNGVVVLETELGPRQLLELCLDIERRFGRDRSHGIANAPRTLDLDLLLYGDRVVDEPGLTLPHPRLEERAFVVEPLVDVDPDLRLPSGSSARERLATFDASELGRVVTTFGQRDVFVPRPGQARDRPSPDRGQRSALDPRSPGVGRA